MILGPLAAVALGATLGVQPYQHRYLVPVTAPFFLLVLLALPRKPQALLAGALLAANLGTAVLFPRDPYLWNQDWDAVARFVQQRQEPDDAVAAYVPYSLVGFTFAYAPDGVAWDFATPGAVQAKFSPTYRGLPLYGLHPAALGPAMDDTLKGKRLFLILNQEDAGGEAIRKWLHPRYGIAEALEVTSLHSWGRITVYVLEPLEGRPETPTEHRRGIAGRGWLPIGSADPGRMKRPFSIGDAGLRAHQGLSPPREESVGRRAAPGRYQPYGD